jgi:phosphoglycolate phosphatase-like HAD superfamily hydrolase
MGEFNPEKEILALDFDGVIVNSIEECLVVGHNSLRKHLGQSGLINRLDELEKGQVTASRQMRNFIRHSEDYVYIFYALWQDIIIRNQSEFDDFLEQYADLQDTFHEIFYRERSRLLETEQQRWLELNPLFPGMGDFIRAYRCPERLVIITTKKAEFVAVTLAAAGIKFPGATLFSADQGLSKSALIAGILRSRAIRPQELHFIDDQVDTLLKARSLGVNLYLARWGYTNEDQVQLAEQEEIAVLSQADFFRQFGNGK